MAKHVFDAAALEPQVAAPHSPANAKPVSQSVGEVIDVAYIGACTGAKYTDLQAAAKIIRGLKVEPNTRLLVAPASRLDQDRAADDGTLGILLEAGAELLPNACGICAGYGNARLGENTRCISSTARNFQGRMGATSSQVWLASPMTVAASAIAGQIVDPRDWLPR
jgi:3-isopropylmalate/(R)-2-methylmalate dehydratase large subunit